MEVQRVSYKTVYVIVSSSVVSGINWKEGGENTLCASEVVNDSEAEAEMEIDPLMTGNELPLSDWLIKGGLKSL